MQIYNSLTRKKEEFEPLNPPEVNMYTCGVTVYDGCHIGHARSLYIFDVMRRYLEYKGFKVNFVRNITDIDDKIINRANELKVDWKELIEKYIQSYREDLKLLDIRLGMVDKDGEEPRATKNIEEIKKYIQALIDKDCAYVTRTGVYFSVRKFKNYGKLSGQTIDEMLVGVRKESDETKEDPLDFALWKIAKPNEPSWPSPWGSGRPGWHIECSVMSTKFLKTDTLDIHAGGLDLIFPHHENEIAQSEAKSGKLFAKCWIHHGLLTINGQKMAKSLGNFITIKDFMVQHKDADYLKLFFLSAHYHSPIDYTHEKIEEAKKQKVRIKIFLDNTNDTLEKFERVYNEKPNLNPEGHFETSLRDVNMYKENFERSMDDDFNTPQAIAEIFNIVHAGNRIKMSFNDRENDLVYYIKLKYARDLISHYLTNIFGLFLKEEKTMLSKIEANLIKERNAARERKDFKKADEFRRILLKKYNIILEDRKDRTEWRKRL